MAKVLTIDTILGPAINFDNSDPLLLTNLDGQEGVSTPYTYDLVLMRGLAEDKKGDVAVDLMLGTAARIGLLGQGQDAKGNPHYHYRTGCFSHFEKAGLSKKQRLLIYKARLIPAVVLWGGGITFRVFEKMNVVDILKEVLDGIKAESGDVHYDISRLNKSDFPRLAYCVQFRESSFGFACRLMAQHGISYFFDKGDAKTRSKAPDHAGSGPAENDTLVLAGPNDQKATDCFSDALDAKNVDIAGGDDIDDDKTIAGFTRVYDSSMRTLIGGNFNMLAPANPIRSRMTPIKATYDVMPAEGRPAGQSKLRREEFPIPADKDPDAPEVKQKTPNLPEGDENRFVTDYAHDMRHREEVSVFKVSGQVKNPTFFAGRTFRIINDETLGGFDHRTFLITTIKINAFENSYMTTTPDDVSDVLIGLGLGILNAALFNIPKSVGDATKGVDATSAMVSSAWGNYLQNQQAVALAKWLYPDSAITHQMTEVLTVPALQGGLGSLWASLLLSNIGGTIKDVITANKGGFSIQFGAVPWQHDLFLRPRVSAPRPTAYGPHLATVIGSHGTQGKDKGQVHADELSRVRVRFPWQLGVPPATDTVGASGGAGADAGAVVHEGTDPLASDRATAWVPVSEAWAGTQMGSNFLPRIGDEVLVDFIDGDPERPIISGRVYYAGQTSNVPLLKPNAASQPVTTKTTFEAKGRSDLTRSGIKTQTKLRATPGSGGGDEKAGFHMLRFDDDHEHKQMLLRSQDRMDVTALGTYYDTTYGNRHLIVGWQDPDTGKSGGDHFIKVSGEYDFHVVKDRHELVDKGYQLSVTEDTNLNFQADMNANVTGAASLTAGSIVLSATNKITLSVGGSSIVIGPGGVYLTGPMIYENSGGSPDTAGTVTIDPIKDPSVADAGDK